MCGLSFSVNSSLNSHFHIHDRELSFKCDSCGSCFVTNSGLTTHLRSYTGKKTFQCDMGGLCLSQHSASKTHFRTHTGEKRFKCELSGSHFARSSNLKTHGCSHWSEALQMLLACITCYAKQYLKTTHLLTYTREKPFKCDMCGLNFALTSKRHFNISHPGEKSWAV